MKKTFILLVTIILFLLGAIIFTIMSPANGTPVNQPANQEVQTEVQTSDSSTWASTSPAYSPNRPGEIEGGGYLGNPYDTAGKLRKPDRCARDTMMCPDGRMVTRKPELYCQFSPCGE